MLAVLFDMDGTLLELDVDIESVRAELRALFAARGYDAEMRPILQRIDEAADAVSSSADEREAIIAEARAVIDRAEVDAAARARACDGARDVLTQLAGDGTPFGLLTDNSRACVRPALAAAGLDHVAWREESVLTRDDVQAPKPDPAGIVRAARVLLPGGGELTMVGDSPRDIAAARAAGALLDDVVVRAVAVRGGRSSHEALAAASPDRTIDDLSQLLG